MLEKKEETPQNNVTVGSIVKTVSQHLWPVGEPGLRARVVIAVTLLFSAKAFNISVPLLFKMIIDSLSTGDTPPMQASPM